MLYVRKPKLVLKRGFFPHLCPGPRCAVCAYVQEARIRAEYYRRYPGDPVLYVRR